jgi:hypothetical protein
MPATMPASTVKTPAARGAMIVPSGTRMGSDPVSTTGRVSASTAATSQMGRERQMFLFAPRDPAWCEDADGRDRDPDSGEARSVQATHDPSADSKRFDGRELIAASSSDAPASPRGDIAHEATCPSRLTGRGHDSRRAGHAVDEPKTVVDPRTCEPKGLHVVFMDQRSRWERHRAPGRGRS